MLHLFMLSCVMIQTVSASQYNCVTHGVESTPSSSQDAIVIAHRGASGTYPEHTLQAYQESVDQGADYVECDVVITKDLQFICSHDNWLGEVTDVKEQFPDCNSTYHVPGYTENITDCFVHELTLSEVQTLGVRQQFDQTRDTIYDYQYRFATLDEYFQLIHNSSGKVGAYIELKNPEFINSLDILNDTRYEDVFIDAIHDAGYTAKEDACFLQCFSYESLVYMGNLTNLPLVMLRTSDPPISDIELDEYQKRGFYGIGPSKEQIVRSRDKRVENITNLVERAHSRGLKVHPYTFRNDFLNWDYKGDIYNEYRLFTDLGIDGAFTDYPATYRRALALNTHCETNKAFVPLTNTVHIILVLIIVVSWII